MTPPNPSQMRQWRALADLGLIARLRFDICAGLAWRRRWISGHLSNARGLRLGGRFCIFALGRRVAFHIRRHDSLLCCQIS